MTHTETKINRTRARSMGGYVGPFQHGDGAGEDRSMRWNKFKPSPERVEHYRRQRRERIMAARAKGTHTKEEWAALVREFNGRCVICDVLVDGAPQKDHIVPIYQGGSDGIDNLQPVCPRCNQSKGPDSTNWVAIRRATS